MDTERKVHLGGTAGIAAVGVGSKIVIGRLGISTTY